jgi:CP family cyanate transporter-like MFS transporter
MVRLRLVQLWLGGAALRMVFLAVPPVLPILQRDLKLSATGVAILTGLPVLMLGGAALLGSLLISRLGAARSVLVGLLLAGFASALRAIAPTSATLLVFTLLMGAGIAAVQPAMAVVVRQWLPTRVNFGTAIYTNGLLMGEVFPAAMTGPLLLPVFGDSWRWPLFIWSIPTIVIAFLFLSKTQSGAKPTPTSSPIAWWPNWRSPVLWRIGLLFGCTNALYFSANAFLPAYLAQRGDSGWLTAALSMLNLGQIPGSFILLGIADRIQGRAWPFVFAGVSAMAAVIGILTTSGIWIVASSALLGFSCAFGVIAGLALPPYLSAAADVPRMAAGMFTISYGSAVVISILCGRLWDFTGKPAAAFLPLIGCGLAQMLLVLSRPFVPAEAAPVNL